MRVSLRFRSERLAAISFRRESMTMVREQKSGSRTNAQRSHDSQNGSEDFQARIAALRSLPREKLADAVFMLWMETQREGELIRRAVKQRVEGEAGPEPVPNADLAAYLAGEAVSSLRHHEVDVPSLADVLIQRSREVRFTVDRTEAVTLLPRRSANNGSRASWKASGSPACSTSLPRIGMRGSPRRAKG